VVLSPEEASTRLASIRDPRWREAAAKRVGGLRRKLRGTASAFIAAPPAQHMPGAFREHRAAQAAAGRQLDEFSDAQRLSIMEALHPGLSPALARWWVDAQSRPYQRHWNRRAFRAHNSPGLTVDGRAADLSALIELLGPFDADPVWLAGWAGHLALQAGPTSGVSQPMGSVLASAIDLGGRTGEETLTTLIDVGNGEHAVGIMGRHVVSALLGATRPEGWDFVIRLLLAAQRQEGLRQTILESADEGHPDAFNRVLTAVLENKLLRFAAAVRAAGVWLGFGADVSEIPKVEDRVRQLATCRVDQSARDQALRSGDAWSTYIALCAHGMRDVLTTIPEAEQLTRHNSPDVRAAAVRYAAATGLVAGQQVAAPLVDDPDVRVATLALDVLVKNGLELPTTFDAITRLVPRLPEKPRTVEPFGIESMPFKLSRADAAARLVDARGTRRINSLLPWLPSMDANGRYRVVASIIRDDKATRDLRPVLVDLLADRSSSVRQQAIAALAKLKLDPREAPAVEALLTRTAADVRRGALQLLTTLPRSAAQASAERLAASADKGQRAAAAELLRTLGLPAPTAPAAATRRGTRQTAAKTPSAATIDASAEAIEDLHATLVRTDERTPALPPKTAGSRGRFSDDRARRIVVELDSIAADHRNTPVVASSWQGSREILFGDIRWFPSPFATNMPAPADDSEEGRGMLLGEVFRSWWTERPAALRGDDSTDALRAHVTAVLSGPSSPFAAFTRAGDDWWRKNMQALIGKPAKELRHVAAVRHVTDWLAAEHADAGSIDECLDALEAALALVPDQILNTDPAAHQRQNVAGSIYLSPYAMHHNDWRQRLRTHPWHGLISGLLRTRPELFTAEQITRWYHLMRWVEQPRSAAAPYPIDTRLLIAAHDAGVATEADVIAEFLHPRNTLFRDLTRRWRTQLEQRHPVLVSIADEVRDRVIDVETRRGDLPTPTSRVALNLSSVSGAELVVRLLRLLGKATLVRGYSAHSDSRDAVFSHLIRVSFPVPSDTPETLIKAAEALKVPDTRLVDLAVYAPQWASFVEAGLQWPGLQDGVLWLHAHTKDEQWSVDRELRESWAAMTAERTPLAAEDLVAGAVDVAWFQSSYAALSPERWAVIHKAAKHASGGNGHRRAQIFAEAMLGQLDEATLTERITSKRNQDSVRALGLLPLPAEPSAHAAAVQRRYALMREFERGSRAFGNQRQTSERTAVRIGIENLARSAGYPDPQRFIWEVEAREAGDLSEGPITVSHDEVSVTLSVTDEGTPELVVKKGDRTLQSVPASLRKADDVVELRARKTALTRQASRVRATLEAAMIGQEAFTTGDFDNLARHPIVAPMLDQLLWVNDTGKTLRRQDSRFIGVNGKTANPRADLRLAHPVDFIAEESWIHWQETVFADGRRQPFKQVFRELYVLTPAEKKAGPASHRYDGHQLQPRQALALFGRRGWLTSRESGDTSRVFHQHNLVARVEFVDGFLTALEADLPTIGGVYFTRRGDHLAQPLDSIPPVVFSETMRDLDLVVSVAHAGGVDPEATASTTEMRAALIRETARLLKLSNISFAGEHALIDGKLGEYSLHLGSGTVHRRPGGAVCIIPVGSQHRGRLFLPFADDDPKTAEVVAKTLMLARDHEIKDPTILEQLHA
jgi:HEAT repeat protein